MAITRERDTRIIFRQVCIIFLSSLTDLIEQDGKRKWEIVKQEKGEGRGGIYKIMMSWVLVMVRCFPWSVLTLEASVYNSRPRRLGPLRWPWARQQLDGRRGPISRRRRWNRCDRRRCSGLYGWCRPLRVRNTNLWRRRRRVLPLAISDHRCDHLIRHSWIRISGRPVKRTKDFSRGGAALGKSLTFLSNLTFMLRLE